MASILKLRRGSSTAHNSFTGSAGEVTLDTDRNVLVVHDGSTLGGFPVISGDALAAVNGTALIGYDGGTAQDVLDSAKPIHDYAALRAYTGRAVGVRITAPGLAGYFSQDTDAISADNGATVIVDAVGRRWKRLGSNVLLATWFGLTGDGSTNNDTALLALRDFLLSNTAAGNRVKVVWPAGRYVYSECPNFAMNRLDLEFQGEVWLINEGTGPGFLLDGGDSGAGVYGMKITGFPMVYGGPSTGSAYYLRAIHRSYLEFNARGAGPIFSGMHMTWCVSNTVHWIMNVNEGGLYSVPAYGIFMTQRGPNEESSYNTFINAECSGMHIGVYQDGALGNLFVGGAVQGCTNVGVQQTPNALANKFIGTDFEVNTNGDVECNARESQFIGCDLDKGIVFQNAAINCSLVCGLTENITVQAGAARTLLSGVVYNRFGGGALTDNGTATRFRDLRNKVEQLTHNTLRSRQEITVGASPFTYTNTTGNEVGLLIAGGVISQLVYTRFAGDVVTSMAGMFSLSPGDAMSVTYSVAPQMIMYTR